MLKINLLTGFFFYFVKVYTLLNEIILLFRFTKIVYLNICYNIIWSIGLTLSCRYCYYLLYLYNKIKIIISNNQIICFIVFLMFRNT